ncbi:MAG: hypothetical protein IJP48_01775 [Synergistaceae bacterium]|nr:hypothetical protein [Synergistaceae bacterium]
MNSNLRVPGASDKYFYYTASGSGATMDVRVNLYFKSKVDVDALRAGLEKALSLFPEFAYRPVIKEGKIFFESNNAPVKVIRHDRIINLGSDETNGYLMAIIQDSEDDKHVIISMYHGISDWRGLSSFLKTALYYYAKIELSPEELAKAEIRTKEPENWDTPENLDPYNTFADKDIEPSFVPDFANYYPLPVEFYNPAETYSHHYRITLSLSEFLKASKSMHTSFMPLMISLMVKAVNNNYDIGSRNILTALPVDLRAVFKCSSIVNFSDAVFIPVSSQELAMNDEDFCAYIKNVINLQRKPENYAKSLYNKACAVREFEKEDIISKSKELTSSVPGGVTYGTSYLGIMDMPGAVNDLFENIFVDAPFALSYFIITTFRDILNVTSIQRFDDDKLARAMNSELIKAGFKTEFTDRGRISHNIVDLEKLRKVE